MFGTQFLENTCIVFTRWGWSKKDVSSRAKNGDSMENKRIDVQNWFSKLFSYNHPIPCFFVDNSYNDENPYAFAEEAEIMSFNTQLKGLREFVISRPPFECKDIKAVLAERERRAQELRDLAEAHRAREAELERQREAVRAQHKREAEEMNSRIEELKRQAEQNRPRRKFLGLFKI